MSVSAGALEDANLQLTAAARNGTATFPGYKNETGQWALAYWAALSSTTLLNNLEAGDRVVIAWKFDDKHYSIRVSLTDDHGAFLEREDAAWALVEIPPV